MCRQRCCTAIDLTLHAQLDVVSMCAVNMDVVGIDVIDRRLAAVHDRNVVVSVSSTVFGAR